MNVVFLTHVLMSSRPSNSCVSFGWKLALRSDTNEDSNEKLNVAEGGGCILLVLTPETHTR